MLKTTPGTVRSKKGLPPVPLTVTDERFSIENKVSKAFQNTVLDLSFYFDLF